MGKGTESVQEMEGERPERARGEPVERCCRSGKEGVGTVPQAAKGGSGSGLKGEPGVWPFMILH